MARNPSDSDDAPSDWLTKPAVATRIGKSLAAVTRYQKQGKLTPKVIEGVNYYDPSEVALVAEEIRKSRDLSYDEQEGDGFALGTMKALVNLIREPRERIDDLQFQMLDRAHKRIEYLEQELDKRKDAIEAAKDQSLERNLAIKQVESENKIKEIAASRLVDTLGKLLTGFGGNKEGVTLTAAQVKELLDAHKEEAFFTPEQVKQAEAIVAKAAAATNGKAVVAAAMSTAKTIVEAHGETKQ